MTMDSNSENESHDIAEVGYSLMNGKSNGMKTGSANTKEKQDDEKNIEIEMETEKQKELIYKIDENPPMHLTIVFGLQQLLLVMANPLNATLIISEIVCMESDEMLKLQVLNALMFITGFATIVMTTFGVRLPIFQGPASAYIIPLLAMTTVKEWTCPATFKEYDPITNKTILMAYIDNSTAIPARDLATGRINELSGSLMAVGVIHFFVGITGLVGFLMRFIGPITIVPTIVMIGLNIYKMVVKFVEPHMGVGFTVIVCNLVFSLLLGKKQTPIPCWSKGKGFHIFWFPLHTVFSILISMLIGWALCAILTAAGALTDDPNDKGYLARTDSRDFVIDQSDWFTISYPGQFGVPSINAGIFINFLIATLISMLDSIGDYAAAARTARVSPPPHFAFNRGIAVEGLMSFFAGTMGCCTATVSYGANIGGMAITRVVSRRVFQVLGLFFIICSVVGKIGAFFITIPYPVLGGTILVTYGLFIGVILSYLQIVDLTSTRNLAIIGISMLSGLMLPHWVSRNGESVNTGARSADVIIQMVLANPSLVAGFMACFMDNVVPGTLKDRGIIHQMKDLDEAEEFDPSTIKDDEFIQDVTEIYRLPYLPQSIRRSRIARKFLPIFFYEDPRDCDEQVKL